MIPNISKDMQDAQASSAAAAPAAGRLAVLISG